MGPGYYLALLQHHPNMLNSQTSSRTRAAPQEMLILAPV